MCAFFPKATHYCVCTATSKAKELALDKGTHLKLWWFISETRDYPLPVTAAPAGGGLHGGHPEVGSLTLSPIDPWEALPPLCASVLTWSCPIRAFINAARPEV